MKVFDYLYLNTRVCNIVKSLAVSTRDLHWPRLVIGPLDPTRIEAIGFLMPQSVPHLLKRGIARLLSPAASNMAWRVLKM
jgi:hypothetical protein